MDDGTEIVVTNPSEFPGGKVAEVYEPMVRATMLAPSEYIGAIMELCQTRRGNLLGMDYLSEDRVELRYTLPLAEIVFDFFDELKSRTRGYASLDYEPTGEQAADLVKVDILLHGEPVDAFSSIVHKDKAYAYGVTMAGKLRELIPRQQFEVPIQAAIGARIIARETIRAIRKDVLAKCYGGDITRKRKLLEKQKEGKKRMKMVGRVEVPQEAFIAALSTDDGRRQAQVGAPGVRRRPRTPLADRPAIVWPRTPRRGRVGGPGPRRRPRGVRFRVPCADPRHPEAAATRSSRVRERPSRAVRPERRPHHHRSRDAARAGRLARARCSTPASPPTPRARPSARPRRSGGWESWSWGRSGERVTELAAGLLVPRARARGPRRHRDGRRGSSGSSPTSPSCAAGGATTTVYPSTQAEDVAFILSDSGSRVVVAEDAGQLAKLVDQRDALPGVEKVDPRRHVDGRPLDPHATTGSSPSTTSPRAAARCSRSDADAVTRANDAVTPDQLATLIYTSGTTGRPKGVELTHGNWTYEGAGDRGHRACCTATSCSSSGCRCRTRSARCCSPRSCRSASPRAVDGRVDKIVDNLAVVKPHFMAGAPRIFEKVYARVVSTHRRPRAARRRRSSTGPSASASRSPSSRQQGKSVPCRCSARSTRSPTSSCSPRCEARLGGRHRDLHLRLRRAVAGRRRVVRGASACRSSRATASPRPRPARASNRHGQVRVGTVGKPFPGTEVKIADDGEILVRGRGVMRGYHNLPEQTAEVLIGDGWFATGDIGEIDDDGHVQHHRPQEGPDQDLGRQVHRPEPDRGAVQGALPAARPTCSCTPTAATTPPRSSPSTPTSPPASPSTTASPAVRDAWPTDPTIEKTVRDAIAELNAGPQPLGDIKDVRILPTTFGRGRRAHAEPEDQAQGRRDEVRRAAPEHVPERLTGVQRAVAGRAGTAGSGAT